MADHTVDLRPQAATSSRRTEVRFLFLTFTIAARGAAIATTFALRSQQIAEKPTRLSVSAELVSNGEASREGYTLVQFQDYECPPCRKSLPTITELVRLYGGKLRVVVRHYPLQMHENAKSAASAAEAARKQGSFNAMHEALYKCSSLSDPEILTIAKRLRLDMERFRGDWKTKGNALVERDQQTADALGVSGTPSYFLCTPDASVWRLGSLDQVHEMVR